MGFSPQFVQVLALRTSKSPQQCKNKEVNRLFIPKTVSTGAPLNRSFRSSAISSQQVPRASLLNTHTRVHPSDIPSFFSRSPTHFTQVLTVQKCTLCNFPAVMVDCIDSFKLRQHYVWNNRDDLVSGDMSGLVWPQQHRTVWKGLTHLSTGYTCCSWRLLINQFVFCLFLIILSLNIIALHPTDNLITQP